jgi:hypothetical protein
MTEYFVHYVYWDSIFVPAFLNVMYSASLAIPPPIENGNECESDA